MKKNGFIEDNGEIPFLDFVCWAKNLEKSRDENSNSNSNRGM